MIDMILRCSGRGKADFVFFNTGLEYRETLEHLNRLGDKYRVDIIRQKPVKPIPMCAKEYGTPFWGNCHHILYPKLGFQDIILKLM